MKFIAFVLSAATCLFIFTAFVEKENIDIVGGTSNEKSRPNHIVIELDEFSQAGNRYSGLTYKENYYYFYNQMNKSLYFYSLEQEINTIKKIVKVPLDESINFRSVGEVYVHSMDSIFIFNDYGYYERAANIFLINAESKIVDKFTFLSMQNEDANKFNKMHAVNGSTMYYHKGKIILPVEMSVHTSESKFKPLYIYDLTERKGAYYGEYPKSFEISKFGNETYNLHASFIPYLGKVYMSFPYESTVYSLDLSDYSWGEIPFKTDLIAQPPAFKGGDDIDKIVYSLNNSWYMGLYYDKASESLLRLALLGRKISKREIPQANSGIPIPGKYDFRTFVINPKTGKYSVISDLKLYGAKLFHPEYGPYQIS